MASCDLANTAATSTHTYQQLGVTDEPYRLDHIEDPAGPIMGYGWGGSGQAPTQIPRIWDLLGLYPGVAEELLASRNCMVRAGLCKHVDVMLSTHAGTDFLLPSLMATQRLTNHDDRADSRRHLAGALQQGSASDAVAANAPAGNSSSAKRKIESTITWVKSLREAISSTNSLFRALRFCG